MNRQDFLLEIGLEELPARFVTDASTQLKSKVEAWLKDNRISYAEAVPFSTPRRLAVLVKEAAEKQDDIEEEAKGPARKIAIDSEGNWTKAAIGFTRGQGASVEDIFFKEINGIEYVHVQKHIAGGETLSLLAKDLPAIITGLSFPKNMRWGNSDLRYARPIKWIAALFGEKLISFEVAGVQSSVHTWGHRFLGGKASISEPSQYRAVLKEQFVEGDAKARKSCIREQLKALELQHSWIIPVDEELLEEVNNLVEYPTALYGSFEEEYLTLPQEVLITSMKEHQRYFPVKNADGKLLPHFVTVRNGDDRSLDAVARGNEKVLKARLSDANFFYKEDQKLSISTAMEKLERVVFHEKLGTVGDKVRRIVKLSQQIGEQLNFTDEELMLLERAAGICKFDLVSHMVYEFPELQGMMGEKYALLAGEAPEVAAAINEHYQPRFAEDAAPASRIGAVVALADKLDSIAGFFSIGNIPTGSQDPYALRRQASGIVQILLAKRWRLSFPELAEMALALFEAGGHEDAQKDILQFFRMRMKHVLGEEGVRYDLIDAVLGSKHQEATALFAKAKVLEAASGKEGFKETVEALARVLNISSKGTKGEIQENLFENEHEKKLYHNFKQLEIRLQTLEEKADYDSVFSELNALEPAIRQYFEHTMVMAPDTALQSNRLSQMVHLAEAIKSFADMNAVIVK
ncbi:glycine--tRNA ligase subunit beta [Bacillus lacus]|uniref:Glycine--tRNA ligase beta subunit n=1 Tax=Metabacillus lacus TaxID=1983721 RepID=A0A7X2IWU8_9BACI|nr:glycine--tRNA ligase subunit beta [Metabacillus lacus]MRX71298.1 glycine--tRNA ligase subunit beta [Metabacillus lacus]